MRNTSRRGNGISLALWSRRIQHGQKVKSNDEVEAEDSGIVTEGGNPMLEAAFDPLAALPGSLNLLKIWLSLTQTLKARSGLKKKHSDQFMKEMKSKPMQIGQPNW